MRNDRYLTPDIFICRDTYEPKGICAKKVCRPKSIQTDDVTLTKRVKVFCNGVLVSDDTNITGKRLEISPYLTTESALEQEMTVYILADGADPVCMASYPPCTDIDALETGVDWRFDGEYIRAELPLPEHCAVESFMTIYSDRAASYTTPGHTGVADGENISLTFDEGGYVSHKTSVHKPLMIPGETVSVSYKLRGFAEYHAFAFIDFQTNIFTSAFFAGAGIIEKVKVYKNPARPEDGYTYADTPVDGGLGSRVKPEWIYDTRLRFAVEYRGETFWMRPVDLADYRIGDRVAVVKSIDKAPLKPSDGITQEDAAEKLSVSDDRIVQELFYS